MKHERLKHLVTPDEARPAKVVPLRPEALLYDRARPCTACRWIRRPLHDLLLGQGDYATCSHPLAQDTSSGATGRQPNCLATRDFLQPCGPAGKLFAPRR